MELKRVELYNFSSYAGKSTFDFSTSKDKNIIKMVIDNKKMTLFAASSDSKSKEELTIDSNNKEKLEISYSSKYMLDALKVLDSENIILLINGDDKPIIINSVDDDTIIELILPIKTY